jgi:hypothetical protein
MAKNAKAEVALANSGALQVSGLLAEQLGELDVTGFENVTADDVSMPILRILQSNSPQVDKKQPDKFLKHVAEGELFNSVTQESYESLTIIPFGFTKGYIEYVPREAGGGFVAKHNAGAPAVSSAQKVGNKLITTNGNELVETAEHFVIAVPESGSPFVALLPLSSTQIATSRKWITDMQNKTVATKDGPKRLPMFYQKYTLSTRVQNNAKGSWYGLNIEFDGLIPDELLPMAKDAAEQFEQTAAKSSGAYAKDAPVGGASNAVVDAVAASME